jgi:hypothetical protein
MTAYSGQGTADRKKTVQPIGAWPVSSGTPVNFDNPIPAQFTFPEIGSTPANLLPKPQANPLGGFSNPKAGIPGTAQPIRPPAAQVSPQPPAPSPILNPDAATQNAFAQAQKQRRPLTTAAAAIPEIGQTAQPGGGMMSVEGGGSATIDAAGNINRGKNWDTSGSGSLSVMPSSFQPPPIGGVAPATVPAIGQTSPQVDANGQPVYNPVKSTDFSPVGTDYAAKNNAPAEAVKAKLGFLPDDYFKNPAKYQNMLAQSSVDLTGQGHLLSAQNQVPVEKIGLEGHKYTADQGLAGHQVTAGAQIQAAEITAEGNKKSAFAAAQQKIQENGLKDTKDLVKTYYEHFKDMDLPLSWSGKQMDLAKKFAMAEDPNRDYGIYYNPASPDRMGIGAKRTDFEPLRNSYLNAGYPPGDAYARAFADLHAAGQSKGMPLFDDIPNMERFRKKDVKPIEAMPGMGG